MTNSKYRNFTQEELEIVDNHFYSWLRSGEACLSAAPEDMPIYLIGFNHCTHADVEKVLLWVKEKEQTK